MSSYNMSTASCFTKVRSCHRTMRRLFAGGPKRQPKAKPMLSMPWGICYRFGRGTFQDITKSTEMLRRAAENGHPQAQNDLGNCYLNGEGVVRDFDQAKQWWKKAALQDIPQALFNLGCIARDHEGNKMMAYAYLKLTGTRHPKAPALLQEVAAQLSKIEVIYAEKWHDDMARQIRG